MYVCMYDTFNRQQTFITRLVSLFKHAVELFTKRITLPIFPMEMNKCMYVSMYVPCPHLMRLVVKGSKISSIFSLISAMVKVSISWIT